LGKLELNKPLAELVSGQQEINKIDILDVKLEHVLALAKLPSHHKDPFDRLLIAQADIEEAIQRVYRCGGNLWPGSRQPTDRPAHYPGTARGCRP